METRREVFVDTSFVVALTIASDTHHRRAHAISEDLIRSRARLVTTHAVLFEVANTLARQRFRRAAVEIVASMLSDPDTEVVPVTPELFSTAFALFRERSDKEWSLTDCVSFVVMRQRPIREALTADRHFRQAGFVPLLDP